MPNSSETQKDPPEVTLKEWADSLVQENVSETVPFIVYKNLSACIEQSINEEKDIIPGAKMKLEDWDYPGYYIPRGIRVSFSDAEGKTVPILSKPEEYGDLTDILLTPTGDICGITANEGSLVYLSEDMMIDINDKFVLALRNQTSAEE